MMDTQLAPAWTLWSGKFVFWKGFAFTSVHYDDQRPAWPPEGWDLIEILQDGEAEAETYVFAKSEQIGVTGITGRRGGVSDAMTIHQNIETEAEE